MSYSSLKSKRIQQSLTNIIYKRGQWIKLDECSLIERRIAKILLNSGNLLLSECSMVVFCIITTNLILKV